MALTVKTIFTQYGTRPASEERVFSEKVELTHSPDEMQSGYMEVAADASDVAIAFGPVTTANEVTIFSDKALSFKLNGIATGIVVKTLVITDGAITAITVSGTGEAAIMRYHLLGV